MNGRMDTIKRLHPQRNTTSLSGFANEYSIVLSECLSFSVTSVLFDDTKYSGMGETSQGL
ncbi:conserved hypothetical protein [Latilactobacillus curvatus]|nr:hypothetical protein CRL705_266 [Latilactobacillus curvatus CRL 705]SMH68670.1 conserved hypothetical protein [Latilactobacillus curvatus]